MSCTIQIKQVYKFLLNSIIKGHRVNGKAVSDNGERPTIDQLVTLQGGPKHTGECIPEECQIKPKAVGYTPTRKFPNVLSSGSSPQSLIQGYPVTVSDRPDPHMYHCLVSGDHSRV
jgi:hypothetical protein